MIMRRYTPFALASSTGAAPPGSVSPLPGTFSVHSGAFSLTSRLADAYSARTFFQSHWSSSATIIGFTVNTPVPSSVWPTRMVTVSSGAIVIQALISGTVASRYQGWAATGTLAASALGGIQKPRTIAPPTAAVVARNSRRSISFVFSGAVFPSGCSGFFSLMMSSLFNFAARLRGGLPDESGDRSHNGRHWSSEHRCQRPRALAAFRAAPPLPGSAPTGSSHTAERQTLSRQAGPGEIRRPTALRW